MVQVERPPGVAPELMLACISIPDADRDGFVRGLILVSLASVTSRSAKLVWVQWDDCARALRLRCWAAEYLRCTWVKEKRLASVASAHDTQSPGPTFTCAKACDHVDGDVCGGGDHWRAPVTV